MVLICCHILDHISGLFVLILLYVFKTVYCSKCMFPVRLQLLKYVQHSQFSGFDLYGNLSQSLDVQQKSQNTRTHWSRIDTQLGVSLMSRKAVFSIFLFNTNSSSSIQIKQRWQWEGTPSSSCLFSSASHCSRAAWLQFPFFLFLLVESKQASCDLWTLTLPVKWVPL